MAGNVEKNLDRGSNFQVMNLALFFLLVLFCEVSWYIVPVLWKQSLASTAVIPHQKAQLSLGAAAFAAMPSLCWNLAL